MTTRNVQTAIVLQGGGALGAYEYGVLKALYDSRPGFRPVAVARLTLGDFSRSSIEARIRAGYEDAMEQGIGDVDAPGLRFGATAADTQRVGATG
jgi:hypothetical protein